MSKLRTFKYMAIASTVFFAGIAGSVCLADSEASIQASSEAADHENSSQNQHAGSTEASRQAASQAGTGSTSDASRMSSSEGAHETPAPAATQPPLTNNSRPSAAGQPGTTTQTNTKVTSNAPKAAPHARTTTYHWGTRPTRVATRTHTHTHVNRSYMVETIHQASR